MAKNGLKAKVIAHAEMARVARMKRDASQEQTSYKKTLKFFIKDIDLATKSAQDAPKQGIDISRECARFVLLSIPDPAQDQSRALFLRQCDTLEHYLSLVQKPSEYQATMQNQFGPNLDARNYTQSDPFNTIIKSQRQRLYAEGQGFNTQEEKEFCRKRSELLVAVEKAYNRLRDQALGRTSENSKGLSR